MEYHWLNDIEELDDAYPEFFRAACTEYYKHSKHGLFGKLGKEDHLQLQSRIFIETYYPKVFLHHSPNEGAWGYLSQWKMKLLGTRAGMPDIMLFKARWKKVGESGTKIENVGMVIELKIKPNKPSKAQMDVLDQLESCGWHTSICYTLREVIDQLEEYMS